MREFNGNRKVSVDSLGHSKETTLKKARKRVSDGMSREMEAHHCGCLIPKGAGLGTGL